MNFSEPIKIVICDDDSLFLPRLSGRLEELFAASRMPVQITTYFSGEQLQRDNRFDNDLYFLDIEMPQISGMDLAARIRTQNPSAVLIFVSSHDQLVFEAIRQQPLRFLRKEKLDAELSEAVNAFLSHYQNLHSTLELHTVSGDVLLSVLRILYVESSGHYLDFVCLDQTFRARGNFSDYLDTLSAYHFIPVSKGVLVNCRHIKNFFSGEILLQNGKTLYLSRGRKNTANQMYLEYLRSHAYETV